MVAACCQVAPVYSISAGLDYPGVGPEHAFFKDSGRVEYVAATDDEAVDALLLLTQKEGILPAIESSHAIAEAIKRAPQLSSDQIIIINVSGRGDNFITSPACLQQPQTLWKERYYYSSAGYFIFVFLDSQQWLPPLLPYFAMSQYAALY